MKKSTAILFATSSLALAVLYGCADGSSSPSRLKKKEGSSGSDVKAIEAGAPEQYVSSSTDLKDKELKSPGDDGEIVVNEPKPTPLPLDFELADISYAVLSTISTTTFGLPCADSEVMIFVNDGEAQGETCTNIGKNVLSVIPSELHQSRRGLCLANEVATGMASALDTYCSKINIKFLKIESKGVAKYINKDTPGVLGTIAAKYNMRDFCACPEGSIFLGGHSPSNNQCQDACGKIVPK